MMFCNKNCRSPQIQLCSTSFDAQMFPFLTTRYTHSRLDRLDRLLRHYRRQLLQL